MSKGSPTLAYLEDRERVLGRREPAAAQRRPSDIVQIIPAADWWAVWHHAGGWYSRERLVAWGLTAAAGIVPIGVEGRLQDDDLRELLGVFVTEQLDECYCGREARDGVDDPAWCDGCAGVRRTP